MVRQHLVVLVLLASATSCKDSVIVENSSDAVVAGVVTRAASTPITGASLAILVVDSARGDTIFNEHRWATDGTGHFSAYLSAFLVAPFTGRVHVTVHPAAADSLSDSTVTGGYVRFGLHPPASMNVAVDYP